jgi:two-component system phosphate regulon response regulator PhoB
MEKMMTANTLANILLVEDEPAIQELLAFNVTQCGYRAIQALDAASAMSHISNALPDLILLDWMLPGISGMELVRRLRADQLTRNVPIIMLTARDDERDKVLGLESGADDYITKPFSPRELMARIRAILRSRAPQMADETLFVGGLELSHTTHRVSANGAMIGLKPTEFRMLRFFMTHAERIYSRSQLLEQVWDDRVLVTERTVDVHIRRLRQALEPSGLNDLLQTVRGSGYRFSCGHAGSRGQRSEVRGQRSEVRGQRSAVSGQRSAVRYEDC